MESNTILVQEREEKLSPACTYEMKMMFNAIKTIEHAFIQKLVDMQAIVFREAEAFTMAAHCSFVMFILHPDNVVTLECIATPQDQRGKGSATKCMEAIIHAADVTGTTIKLRATQVTNNGMMMGPMAVCFGANKKGKIPVRQLPAWYKKFGFETLTINKKGTYMKRIPKTLEVSQ